MKRLKKILFWFFSSLAMLVLLAFLFTQTTWFRNIIRTQAVEIVNKSIKGKVTIGEIEGSLFTELTLNNLSITFIDGDTLISVEKIDLSYAPLYLLRNEIRVNSMELINPDIRIGMDKDSIWNFERLIIQQEKKESAPFSMVIQLSQFNISNGKLRLIDFSPLTPEKFDSLNLDLSARYTSKKLLAASLKHLGFKTSEPNIRVKTFRLDLDFKDELWKISNFFLATVQNQITADAGYNNLSNFSADVNWPAVDASEFAFALPTITIPANPNFNFKAVTEKNQLNLTLNLNYNQESISITGKVNNLNYLLTDSLRHLAPVDFLISTRNLVPNNWIEMTALPLVLNTDMQITGNGLKQSSQPLKINATLGDSRWENIVLKEGKLQLTYLAGKTDGTADLSGLFGVLHVKTSLNLKTPSGPFTATVLTENLDLHQLLPTKIDTTLINLSLTAHGFGVISKNPEAVFTGTAKQSIVEHIPVDTLFFEGNYKNGNLALDSVTFQNNSVALSLVGFYNKNGQIGANVTSKFYNTSAFSYYFKNPTQWQTGNLQSNISGNVDSLGFDLIANFSQLKMDTTLLVNSINIEGKGMIINKKIQAKTLVKLIGFEASSFKADSANVSVSLMDTIWDATLSAQMPEETNLLIHATGNTSGKIKASLHQLNYNAPYTTIHLQESPALITYHKNLIQIENLFMIDDKDSSMVFKADALVAMPDSIAINAHIKGFNLEILHNAGFMSQIVKGRGDLNLNFMANKRTASFTGLSSFTELEFDQLSISKITTQFNYNGDSMMVNSAIYSPVGDSILLNGASKLTIKLQDSLTISWPQTFRAHLTTTQTRLNAFYKANEGIDQPKALVNINLSASGHLNDPFIKGYIDIAGGELPWPKYGINYQDIRLKLIVDGPSVQLDTLFLRHLKGTLLARGSLQMNSPLKAGSIKSSDISIVADNFFVSRHRDHEIQVDANVNFRDEGNSSKFGGKITVLQSSFFIPALLEMADGQSPKGEPLLVQALREKKEVIVIDTIAIPKPKELSFTLMEKLEGNLKIEIPRNTWIKSDVMQVEVFGSLDVVKNSKIFELFGTVGINRGYYTLYGKKLVIEDGEFIFSGGEAFDPQLDLKAKYAFRGKDRAKRTMDIYIKGKVSYPEISFELDKQIIPEADAMAYLLFGQPFDQLSYGNQEGVSSAMPTRLVSGLVSSQLSRTLGSTLRLDMIEIDAGDNWQNTTFMVGKYITNNLFVTYQKSFGQAADQEITPEVITLEYEIGRHISLRLIQGDVKESGVDIILKFEK